MTTQRQIWFWLGGVLAVGIVLYLLGNAIVPFAAGLILAYLLDPLADRLENLGLSRLAATIVILVLFLIFLGSLFVVIVPMAVKQLGDVIVRLPEYTGRFQAILSEYGAPLINRFGTPQMQTDFRESIGGLVGQGAGWITSVLGSVWAGGQAVIGIVALLFITPVVAFYLLMDWDRLVAAVDRWLPRDHRDTIRQLAYESDQAIAGFLRGQGIVCLLLGGFYAIGLTLMGLSFGALIGLTTGILSFIPYVGSTIGLLLSVGVALVQFWPDWVMPLIALAIFSVGQFLEGNILSPKLVGDSVGLHPVWLMFALLAFGTLFGFVGLLLAVPIAAIIGVLLRFALRQYLASSFYAGNMLDRPPGDGEV